MKVCDSQSGQVDLPTLCQQPAYMKEAKVPAARKWGGIKCPCHEKMAYCKCDQKSKLLGFILVLAYELTPGHFMH